LSHSVDHAAVLAIFPFRQARDDTGSNRLQLSGQVSRANPTCANRPAIGESFCRSA
jgi:hypothetical protein